MYEGAFKYITVGSLAISHANLNVIIAYLVMDICYFIFACILAFWNDYPYDNLLESMPVFRVMLIMFTVFMGPGLFMVDWQSTWSMGIVIILYLVNPAVLVLLRTYANKKH